MDSNIIVVCRRNFGNVSIAFLKPQNENTLYLTAKHIGKALGFGDPVNAIMEIHEHHRRNLDALCIYLKPSEGGSRPRVIYSLRGVCEIIRYSNLEKGEFMQWIWDFIGHCSVDACLLHKNNPINPHLSGILCEARKDIIYPSQKTINDIADELSYIESPWRQEVYEIANRLGSRYGKGSPAVLSACYKKMRAEYDWNCEFEKEAYYKRNGKECKSTIDAIEDSEVYSNLLLSLLRALDDYGQNAINRDVFEDACPVIETQYMETSYFEPESEPDYGFEPAPTVTPAVTLTTVPAPALAPAPALDPAPAPQPAPAATPIPPTESLPSDEWIDKSMILAGSLAKEINVPRRNIYRIIYRAVGDDQMNEIERFCRKMNHRFRKKIEMFCTEEYYNILVAAAQEVRNGCAVEP